MMKRMHVKLIVASVAVVLAVGFLALVGVSKAQVAYLEVDDFLGKPDYHARTVRLRGLVADGSIRKESDGLVLRFDLAGQSRKLPVRYGGAVPDMFQPGGEVVAEGRLDGQGVFQAATLVTKCASKYKPQDHPASSAAGSGAAAEGPR